MGARTTRINPDDRHQYIGYVEGYIATSTPDAHGDQIPPRLIDEMAKRVQTDVGLQEMTLNHDPSQKIGRILEIRVDKKPGWVGLWAKAGIFKDRPDAWELLESGNLKGFSVTVGVKDYSGKVSLAHPSGECQFRVAVPGAVWHDVDDLLRGAGADTYPVVRKAFSAETVIAVSGAVASVPSLVFSLLGWLQSRNKAAGGGTEDVHINIVVEERRIQLSPDTADEIIQRVRVSVRKKNRRKRN
jgi:hypothetical protein